MPLLSRRLYNGGFNHLRSTYSLIYHVPGIIREQPLAQKLFIMDTTSDMNNKNPTSQVGASSPDLLWHPPTNENMSAHLHFEKANEKYVANFGDNATLPIHPNKKLAIVTCMDARLNVFGHLGIKEGEAHIIRNAGGAAKDALRSIIISQRLLGTREIAVFHHTACGMLTFSSPHLRTLVKESDPKNSALSAVDDIDFLEFSNLEQSVKEDVKFLKENPLVLSETKITGWVYEVETGKVKQIV